MILLFSIIFLVGFTFIFWMNVNNHDKANKPTQGRLMREFAHEKRSRILYRTQKIPVKIYRKSYNPNHRKHTKFKDL